MAWQDRGMARAAVIGAEVGGLATAVALQRRGRKITVREPAAELPAAGAIRPVASPAAPIPRPMDPVLTWRPPT
jgi:glycine/D-amino acid oxidase-like deaminating enzyme